MACLASFLIYKSYLILDGIERMICRNQIFFSHADNPCAARLFSKPPVWNYSIFHTQPIHFIQLAKVTSLYEIKTRTWLCSDPAFRSLLLICGVGIHSSSRLNVSFHQNQLERSESWITFCSCLNHKGISEKSFHFKTNCNLFTW